MRVLSLVPRGAQVATRSTCGAYLALQAEVVALMDARRQLHERRAGVPGGHVSQGETKRYVRHPCVLLTVCVLHERRAGVPGGHVGQS